MYGSALNPRQPLASGQLGSASQAYVVGAGVQVEDTRGTIRVYLGNIPNGDYGLQVVGPDGSTVIIDGTSDMFRIALAATASATQTGDGTTLVDTTYPAAGSWASGPPVCITGVSFSNGTFDNVRQQGREITWSNFWAAATSGGATTSAKRGVTAEGSCGSYASSGAGNPAGTRVGLTLWGNGAGAVTCYAKVYLLAQVAL